ncbi:ExbD/TolR family protein [Pontiella agarivorans]|uniref:Biopolymer transporter ExbD n=1 Tax=Pontiella agarivorans TaxID=3038953 RepID=A0ABU5N1D8_9BACT|nr:biopolymer transporter ExbD [Pontiella agarivorans]MDZ8120218.1 biopolymer transporter ExbD [Pontiella agarivorans]
MDLMQHYEESPLKLEIASLIDVVFLLLIYFMVTASLIKKEADIGFMLPANVAVEDMQEIPVEVLIEITRDGTVQVEGMRFSYDDRELEDLVVQVAGLKEIAASQNSPFFVNVLPHADALHRRIIDVMDACAAAGVNSLTFSKSM